MTDTGKNPHEWRTSTLGHGEKQCIHCFATDREIAVIGDMNHCPATKPGPWKRIETLPDTFKDGDQIFMKNSHGPLVAEWSDYWRMWVTTLNGDAYGMGVDPEPTHWMPIPEGEEGDA